MAETEKKVAATEAATEEKAAAKKPAAKKPAAKKAEGEAKAPAKKPAAKKPAAKKAEGEAAPKKSAAKKAEGEAAPKKAAAPKAGAAGVLTIKLVKSLSGRSTKQIATAKSLGLTRIGDVTVQPDNAPTSGKIAKNQPHGRGHQSLTARRCKHIEAS